MFSFSIPLSQISRLKMSSVFFDVFSSSSFSSLILWNLLTNQRGRRLLGTEEIVFVEPKFIPMVAKHFPYNTYWWGHISRTYLGTRNRRSQRPPVQLSRDHTRESVVAPYCRASPSTIYLDNKASAAFSFWVRNVYSRARESILTLKDLKNKYFKGIL